MPVCCFIIVRLLKLSQCSDIQLTQQVVWVISPRFLIIHSVMGDVISAMAKNSTLGQVGHFFCGARWAWNHLTPLLTNLPHGNQISSNTCILFLHIDWLLNYPCSSRFVCEGYWYCSTNQDDFLGPIPSCRVFFSSQIRRIGYLSDLFPRIVYVPKKNFQ